jgi:hypothetical protein
MLTTNTHVGKPQHLDRARMLLRRLAERPPRRLSGCMSSSRPLRPHQQFRSPRRGDPEELSAFGDIPVLAGELLDRAKKLRFIQSIGAGTDPVKNWCGATSAPPNPRRIRAGTLAPTAETNHGRFGAFAGPRSGASSVKGVAVFFSDFGCFGFLASRFDLLCPFAIANFLVLIVPASGMVGVGTKTPPGLRWGSSMPLTGVRPHLRRGAEFDLECDHSAADPVLDVVEAIGKIFECRATRQHKRQQAAFEHNRYAARREPCSRNITHRLFPCCCSSMGRPLDNPL